MARKTMRKSKRRAKKTRRLRGGNNKEYYMNMIYRKYPQLSLSGSYEIETKLTNSTTEDDIDKMATEIIAKEKAERNEAVAANKEKWEKIKENADKAQQKWIEDLKNYVQELVPKIRLQTKRAGFFGSRVLTNDEVKKEVMKGVQQRYSYDGITKLEKLIKSGEIHI